MRKAPLELEDIADAVQDKLEHVKLADVTDAAFKGGVWVSCVLGVKFLLDLIEESEWWAWLSGETKVANMTKTALKSVAVFQVTASGPLSLVPLFQELLKDEEAREQIRTLAVEANLVYLYSNTLNPVVLAQLILNSPDAVKALLVKKQGEFEEAQARYNAKYHEWELAVQELQMYLFGSSPGDPHGEWAFNKRIEIDRLKAELDVLAAEVKVIRDAQAVYAEAVKRTFGLLSWGIALVIGTYLAGSMIYAGDTLLDSIGTAFKTFGNIPFKGVV